jgi:hypothetical protein
MIAKIIMFLLNFELKKIRKHQTTPYMFIKGTGKNYPKYVMYTDQVDIAREMHKIE